MNWFLFWLFLHMLAAVVAFGPIFTFPVIGISAAREPRHALFAARVNKRIEEFLVVPLAASMLVSGSGLLITAHVDLLKTWYLLMALALYVVAMALALGVAVPTVARMVRLLDAAPAVPSGAAAPDIARLDRRVRVLGGVLQLLFLVIIFLMIVKPGGIVSGEPFG